MEYQESISTAKYCRACFSSDRSNLVDIFQNEIDQLYSEFTNCQISSNDLYSKQICFACIDKLNDFKKFRKVCDQSMRKYFEEVISKESRIKTEADDVVELKQECDTFVDSTAFVKLEYDYQDDRSLGGYNSEDYCNFDSARGTMKRTKKHTYFCDICGFTFNRKKPIRKHMVRHKRELNKNRKHFCNLCNKQFASDHLVKRHKLTHNKEKNFICTFENCNWATNARRYLLRHILTHKRPPVSVICDTCGKSFQSNQTLKIHKATHSEVKAFLCTAENCNFATNTDSHLKKHFERLHALERNFSCTKCDSKFSTASLLKIHQRAHSEVRNFVCNVCGKGFKTNTILRTHISMVHSEARPYVCEICNYGYKAKSDLKEHEKRFHQEPKIFECDSCTKTFLYRKGLVRHKLLMHATERPFECDFCDLKYALKSALNKHLKVHSHARDKVCRICGAEFKHSGSLSNHMKTHKKEQKIRNFSGDNLEEIYD